MMPKDALDEAHASVDRVQDVRSDESGEPLEHDVDGGTECHCGAERRELVTAKSLPRQMKA